MAKTTCWATNTFRLTCVFKRYTCVEICFPFLPCLVELWAFSPCYAVTCLVEYKILLLQTVWSRNSTPKLHQRIRTNCHSTPQIKAIVSAANFFHIIWEPAVSLVLSTGPSVETTTSTQNGAVVAAEAQIAKQSCLKKRKKDWRMNLTSLLFWKNLESVDLSHLISWSHTKWCLSGFSRSTLWTPKIQNLSD